MVLGLASASKGAGLDHFCRLRPAGAFGSSDFMLFSLSRKRLLRAHGSFRHKRFDSRGARVTDTSSCTKAGAEM